MTLKEYVTILIVFTAPIYYLNSGMSTPNLILDWADFI